MSETRVRRSIPLPLTVSEWAYLEIATPLTLAEWNQLMTTLEAMRPAIVESERDPEND